MDARKLKRLLEAEKAEHETKQKRIRSLPADLCCENCSKWIGSSFKRWRRHSDKQICIVCYDYYTTSNVDWYSLTEAEKVQLVYTLIVNNQPLFKKICRYDDEIYDISVLDRINNFVQNYNPERGILLSYLKNAIGWYAIKAVALRNKQRMREMSCGAMPLELFKENHNVIYDDEEILKRHERNASVDYLNLKGIDGETINDASNVTNVAKALYSSYVEDHIPICELLESLHPFDRWLIENHIINGFSQQSLAEASGRSKATINVWISRICEQLKREYKQLEE